MKGKGSQFNPPNPFLKKELTRLHPEGIDEDVSSERPLTKYYQETPKSALSRNNSPDLKWAYSVNPYQGCEHGCIYCYARNSHTYWGFSAGLDFESNIIVKSNIAAILETELSKTSWQVQPVMLSGNTDCYQPAERELKLTREVLKTLLKFRNPVSLITKNALILRDKDLLQELASHSLVHVYFSLTTLDEVLRSQMEPRTSTAVKKLEAIRELSDLGVPVGIMMAPIIPGLNQQEIPEVLRRAAESGARSAGYTVVRLNGQIPELFEDWLSKYYPERKEKVVNLVKSLHRGKMNDSEWGQRLKGHGNHALIIDQLFQTVCSKYFGSNMLPPYNLKIFRKGGNYQLFGT